MPDAPPRDGARGREADGLLTAFRFGFCVGAGESIRQTRLPHGFATPECGFEPTGLLGAAGTGNEKQRATPTCGDGLLDHREHQVERDKRLAPHMIRALRQNLVRNLAG
jgi:hypothetical protein